MVTAPPVLIPLARLEPAKATGNKRGMECGWERKFREEDPATRSLVQSGHHPESRLMAWADW
jgi:hypothetical protein